MGKLSAILMVTIISIAPLSSWADLGVADNLPEVDYQNYISCPSEEEFQAIILEAKINVGTFPPSQRCDDSELSRLITLLKALKAFNFEMPLSKAGVEENEILKRVSHPWEFFINSYEEINFYYSNRAYAAFSVFDRKMHLAPAIFELPVVTAQSILVHEAAHSLKEDKGHVECRSGGLKFSSGGCDNFFLKEAKNAGSYSYQFWFLWGASEYASSLTEGEKRIAFLSSQDLLSQRFNYVFNGVSFNDLAVVLDSQGKALVLDPLTEALVDIGFNSKILNNKKVRSVHKDYKNSGLTFVTEDGKLFNWSAVTELTSEGASSPLVEDVTGFKSFGSAYNYSEKSTRTVVISKDGIAWIEQTRLDTGMREYVKFDEINLLGKVESVELLIGRSLAVLYETGEVKIFGDTGLVENQEVVNGYKYITGDYSSYQVYLVSLEGELKSLKRDVVSIVSGVGHFVGLKWESHTFKGANTDKVSKYNEGVGYRGVLDEEGLLYFKRQERENGDWDVKPYNLTSKIKDFVFVPVMTMNMENIDTDKAKDFNDICGVKAVEVDPWLKRLMGINKSAELILFHQGVCMVLAKDVSSFHVRDRALKENVFGFIEKELWISFSSGDEKIISGY